MRSTNDRAFKEWAAVCEAMKSGRQILLIRKGGIREDAGIFRVDDPEFFLMPTYEHQTADLLQPEHTVLITATERSAPPAGTVRIDAYAVVDTVANTDDEGALNSLAGEYIWNERYVRQRLDFNPYDPLYVLLLRVYRLPEPFVVPMRPAYEGCKSWVSLESACATEGAKPALDDESFAYRKKRILARLLGSPARVTVGATR